MTRYRTSPLTSALAGDLARDEIETLIASLPATGHTALRDRTLLLFLYNTVLVSRKRRISGSGTWSLGPSHASICMARATSGVPVPCGQRRRGCCVSCSPSGQPSRHQLLRYSHPDKVGRSPDTGFTSLFVGMRRT